MPDRPGRTGKSHVLVALGVAAVQAGHKVRYFTAASRELSKASAASSTATQKTEIDNCTQLTALDQQVGRMKITVHPDRRARP